MNKKYKTMKIIFSLVGCVLMAVSVFCFVQSSREFSMAEVSKGTAMGLNSYGYSTSAVSSAFSSARHYDDGTKYRNIGIGTTIIGVGCIAGAITSSKKEKLNED